MKTSVESIQEYKSLTITSKARMIRIISIFIIGIYVITYIYFSRRGYEECSKFNNNESFYFFTPNDFPAWQKAHNVMVVVFYPLIQAERIMGSGRPLGKDPVWDFNPNVKMEEAPE
jgi:hypothetical protein